MAPASAPTPTPTDAQNVNMQSIHATLQQFHAQSPQLFWLVVCVFSFSFGLTVICVCYKIGMILWKGPNWNADPRLIPPLRKLKAYPPRLASRSNSTLARSETGRWKKQLLEDDRKLFVAPPEERKLATISRRSWTQSLLAHGSLLAYRNSGEEIWLGDHLEQCKTEGVHGLVSPLTPLSEKETIAAPAPCLVKGTGVACASIPKPALPDANVGHVDKRASLTSQASAYSQDSPLSSPVSPNSSVPSIIVESCDSPSHLTPSSLTSLQVLTPDTSSPPRAHAGSLLGETSEQELLRVPHGAPRTRPRKPSFASSRGTSHVTGRRFTLAAPPPRKSSRKGHLGRAEHDTNAELGSPEHKAPGHRVAASTSGVGRGRGKENSAAPGYSTGPMGFPRGPARDRGFEAPRMPLATRTPQGTAAESVPWLF
ncbi:hypothetical protein PsYK624_050560 [Phanerochaete sordida]|uniref:Uncharacterized protein n=1 Tax=Phanerochaete sordida TaxID=48140 RepID=A0A9P3G4F7_9APHY|nr:hypothetical protein PsYK624_050560 [Phanerochaete sordida]